MVISGNYLYIGAHNDGIWTADVSNPAKPKEISFISNLGRNVGMDLVGNNLYVAGAWSSLSIIDVTDGANPKMPLYHFGTSATAVLADGNYVYTDQGIVDMTNIKSPVYLSKSPYFAGSATKFGNNYLIVASGDGLHILDVSNKKSPVLVTTFEPGVSYSDVKIHGNIAVAASGNSILTIDLSNVKAPKRLSQLTYSGIWYARALALHDTIVYAAGYGIDDVRAFDISDPAHIKLIDSIDLGGNFGTISYDNGYLAVGEKMATYILSTSLVPSTPPGITSTPSITVTSANGGETWKRGTTQTITWSYAGSPGSTVKIVLLKGSTEVGTIVDSVSIGSSGKGSYSWPIASSGSGGTGSDYKVSIQSISQPSIQDTSNNYFTIAPGTTTPSITVSEPSGGETWKRGTTQTIAWSYAGSPGSTVKIVLLKGSTEVGAIVDSVSIGSSGKGSYSWPIASSGSGGTGSDYKVSIQSISQPSIQDTSNNYFTIASGTVTPAITVTSPNGGETLKRGTTQTIVWSYAGSPGSTVKIVLLKGSTEVGAIVDSVSIGSSGKGSYSWPIASSGSGGTGSDYKVSIQSISQPSIQDTSNNYFTITSGTVTPAITVTSPKGGKR